MRKVFLIVAVLFFLMFTCLAIAHPPTDIIFKYDAKGKILSVGVAHSAKDFKKHFIKEIKIEVNGQDWIVQDFLSQPTLDVQAASYAQVDLKKGDIIEILVVCNQAGQLSKKFKIEK